VLPRVFFPSRGGVLFFEVVWSCFSLVLEEEFCLPLPFPDAALCPELISFWDRCLLFYGSLCVSWSDPDIGFFSSGMPL